MSSPLNLRHAFGRFPTGIAVITTIDEQGNPYGLTINSFVSVSLEPPVLSWNVMHNSRAYEVISRAKSFMVHILSSEQQALSKRMTGPIDQRFDGVSYRFNEIGLPVIDGCLAAFVCDLRSMISIGDHDIVLGDIQDYDYQHGEPLVYWQGNYGRAVA